MAWVDNQPMSVGKKTTDCTKRILTYQKGSLYSKEIVCFAVQRYYKGKTGNHSYRVAVREAGQRFVPENWAE